MLIVDEGWNGNAFQGANKIDKMLRRNDEMNG
jgi:hypothetical protein